MKYSIYLGTPQGAGSQKKNCTRRDGRAGRPLMIPGLDMELEKRLMSLCRIGVMLTCLVKFDDLKRNLTIWFVCSLNILNTIK